MKFTPKHIFLAVVGFILFALVYTFTSGMMGQQSMGLSGATTVNAPSFAIAMDGSGGYAPRAMSNKMAISVGESAPSYNDNYMPSPLPANAPAGVSKIVKNGNLTLLVKNVDDATFAINNLRTSLAGQPGNASFSEYGNGGKQGDITIWVPSDKFDEAMLAIKKLALRVENERVSVEDVSAQYVDLQSRLKNLKASEEQYLLILKQSGKISDVLAVTQQLNQTRAEIEQTQGQMDYLSRQVALSSIHISLTQEAVPGSVVANEWRPMTVAKAALSHTLTGLTDAIDTFLIILISLPVLLLNLGFWLLIAWGCYRVGRFVYRRISATTTTNKDGV
jgi:hypothetical protein